MEVFIAVLVGAALGYVAGELICAELARRGYKYFKR